VAAAEEWVMSRIDAWKNAELRTADDLHPAGSVDLSELTDIELEAVDGAGTGLVGTFGCCWCVPWYSGFTVCGLICSHPGCR